MIDLEYVRHFRIGQYAIFDFAVSYLGMYVLSPVLTMLLSKIHLNISRSDWMWLTLPISIVFHAIFKQQTPFMKLLLKPDHYYIELLLIVCMLYMGLRNIRSRV